MTPNTAIEALTKAAEALEPFAAIGQWLFARPLPDDTPLVEVDHLNGIKGALTRGHFKAAHLALTALAEQMEAALSTLIVPKTYEMGVEDAAKVADRFGLDLKAREQQSLAASSEADSTSGRDVEMEYAVSYARSHSFVSRIAAEIRTLTNPGGNNG